MKFWLYRILFSLFCFTGIELSIHMKNIFSHQYLFFGIRFSFKRLDWNINAYIIKTNSITMQRLFQGNCIHTSAQNMRGRWAIRLRGLHVPNRFRDKIHEGDFFYEQLKKSPSSNFPVDLQFFNSRKHNFSFATFKLWNQLFSAK